MGDEGPMGPPGSVGPKGRDGRTGLVGQRGQDGELVGYSTVVQRNQEPIVLWAPGGAKIGTQCVHSRTCNTYIIAH